ncbi:hypothetical protein SIM26_004411, partial [Salmonella enterica]|nr:hypothetical protein [Salmonella enterica]EKQ2567611.1 hypothetical protein [Salmonella enterica]ELR1400350.1 hypothetical protein [Salmonella enterica]ELW8747439.1 hypothetical protein [Salmonella enterica]
MQPEEGLARHALSADNHTTVSVKRVVFTGNPPGLKGLSEADLQCELATDLNHPQTFAGLEAMAQKITALYRHHGLLVARAVLFVGRCFYWTDYNLPEWLALERYGFCTWDAMQDPFSRRMELRRFSRLCVDVKDAGEVLRL